MMKTYLGDAVYAEYDGNSIILTTENGISASNTIYMEPEVLSELEKYVERLRRRARESKEQKKAVDGSQEQDHGQT